MQAQDYGNVRGNLYFGNEHLSIKNFAHSPFWPPFRWNSVVALASFCFCLPAAAAVCSNGEATHWDSTAAQHLLAVDADVILHNSGTNALNFSLQHIRTDTDTARAAIRNVICGS